ncbi:MAG: ABC transporter permease [Clostridiales bacterium]|nr:ABC transporter permease [Clostridiales bacterium]
MTNTRKGKCAKYFEVALYPVIATCLALLVGVIIMLVTGHNPVDAYLALFEGAFGSSVAIAETLSRSTPLFLTGLAVAFAFKCGLFNIGVEGQLHVGAMAAAVVGCYLTGLPAIAHIPLTLLAAAVVAGIWAGVPGYLKARFRTHEVINTIMMNHIAIALVSYLVVHVFRAPGVIPRTSTILPSAQLYRFIEFSRLNIGLFMAMIALYLIYYLLWKTNVGYEIRAVGHNDKAAECAGINVKRNIVMAMVISGMLGGLAGAERIMGLHLSFIQGFSPGYGFEGIAVALLGRNHPLGILFSAILFGALANGGFRMSMATAVPTDLATVIQAVVVFFVAAEQLAKLFIKRRKKGRLAE